MKFKELFPGLTKHELFPLAIDNGYSDAETKELQEMFRETCLDKNFGLEKLPAKDRSLPDDLRNAIGEKLNINDPIFNPLLNLIDNEVSKYNLIGKCKGMMNFFWKKKVLDAIMRNLKPVGTTHEDIKKLIKELGLK